MKEENESFLLFFFFLEEKDKDGLMKGGG